MWIFFRKPYIFFILFLFLFLFTANIYPTKSGNYFPEESEDTLNYLNDFKTGQYENQGGKELVEYYNEMRNILEEKNKSAYIMNNIKNVENKNIRMFASFRVNMTLKEADDMDEKRIAYGSKFSQADDSFKERVFDLSSSFTGDVLLDLLDGKIKKEEAKGLQAVLLDKIGELDDEENKNTLYGITKKMLGEKSITVEKIKDLIKNKQIMAISNFGIPFYSFASVIEISFFLFQNRIEKNIFSEILDLFVFGPNLASDVNKNDIISTTLGSLVINTK